MVLKYNIREIYSIFSLCLLLYSCERSDLAPYEVGNSENVFSIHDDMQIDINTTRSSVHVLNSAALHKGHEELSSDNGPELLNGKSPDVIDQNNIEDRQSESNGQWVTVPAKNGGIDTSVAQPIVSTAVSSPSIKTSKSDNEVKNIPTKTKDASTTVKKPNIKQDTKNKESTQKTTEYVKPVDGTTSLKFGENDKDGLPSDGIIIRAPAGTPVKAFCSGSIIYAGSDKLPEYGNMVLIKHKNDTVSMYAHLNKISVKKNEKVSAGDIIGNVGKTGEDVTSPQLYFQLMKGNEPLDPSKYF